MKKPAAFFLITAMVAVLSVLFVFMCLPFNHSKAKAIDGVLDLRGRPMENVIFPLSGEWHFYFNELLTAEDLAKTAKTPEKITAPSFWTNSGYPMKGFATYRLIVKTEDPGPFTLYVPEISSAYALWINGEKMGGAGVVSATRENEQLRYSNALIPVSAKNGEIDLCLQVSNLSHIRSGMYIPLKLGRTDEILADFFRGRAFYMLGMGGILMMAFYYLALYLFRRKDNIYLVFSLLCATCFLRFLLETDGLNYFFQTLPVGGGVYRLYLQVFFGNAFLVLLFSFMFFEPDFLKKHKRAVIAYVIAGLLLNAVLPLNFAYAKPLYSLFFAIPYFFTITRMAKSEKIRQNPLTRLYLITLVLGLIGGFAYKIFFDNSLYMFGLITNLFLIMSQGLMLSQNYTRAFEAVEEINANLEQLVAGRTKDLQNTNNAMKELVGNISHDLKTPLSIMSVNLEKLFNMAQTISDADYARHIRIAFYRNLDLQRLTQNLFEVSRIETGQQIYASEWVSLRELLAQVQEKYDDFLDSREIFFDVSFAQDAQIWIDRQKIWSIFDNVVYNAVRHTEPGGTIAITAEKQEKTVSISVKDTGCGIAPEHLPHIFNRFYKVSSARGAKEGESGVGLYIVKKIAEGFGGGVAAESELGKGTSIIVSFEAME